MKRFTVVTIRRTRADYIVEAADARDAWNRVGLVESMPDVSAAEYGVTRTREPMQIEHERFVIEVPQPSKLPHATEPKRTTPPCDGTCGDIGCHP